MDDNFLTAGLPFGTPYRTPGRTYGAGECAVLMSMLGTRGAIHTDREAATQSIFGELTLAGPVVAAAVAGLSLSSQLLPTLASKYGVRVLAGLGIEARYRSPFVVGDTIWIESSARSARVSGSRPGQAILTMVDRAVNQRGETVIDVVRHQLYERDGT